MATPAGSAGVPKVKPTARTIGHRPRASMFVRVLAAITALIQVPFAFGITEGARRLGLPWPWVFGVVVGGLSIVLFGGRIRAGMPDRRRASSIGLKLIDIPFYVHWCACVFTIIPAIVATIVAPIAQLVRGEPLALPSGFFLWTYLLGVVISAYGILVRRRWFRVREVAVDVPGLDPIFDGFRIAHLSDLHIGTNTPKSWGRRWTSAANRREADIAVVTGDLVSSGCEYHDDIAEVVGELTAKDGVFVSMGNHDYFGEGEPLVSLLKDKGVQVLRNEGVVLERSGKPLYLAGIDDTWTRRDDIDSALGKRPKGAPTVLLSHDPERFVQAAERGVALTLSGHTHGGQIAVPFFSRWASLSHLTHHFHQGLYHRGKSTLYVHPGLGTTGPPMRLGAAPAVVILTLRSAPA